MIIALGHLSRTGKDTVADMLDSCLPCGIPGGSGLRSFGTFRTGFIWEAKKIANQLFGWAGVREREYYDANPEARTKILPALGTSALQIWIDLGIKLNEVHPKALIGKVLHQAHQAEEGSPISPSRHTVIADLRRESEITSVRAAGGIVVKVHRPGAEAKSETDKQLSKFTKWDYIIMNEGTKDDLLSKVARLSEVISDGYQSHLHASKYICPMCHSRVVSSYNHGSWMCMDSDCNADWTSDYNREIA